MRPAAAVRHLRTLWGVSGAASRIYGGGRINAARTALRLRRENGFDLVEALREGVLDPQMEDSRRFSCIGRAMRRPAQDRLNPPSLAPFTEEKIAVHGDCAASGLPVPRLYGAFGRSGGWSRITGRPITDRSDVADFIRSLPGDVVVKPTTGHEGLGIRLLTRDRDGTMRDSSGGVVDPGALYDTIVADPAFDLHVVQERIRNHPEVEELAGSPVLQTLRINTIVRADGTVLVFGAAMKLATGTGDADNFHDGATGNGFCEVALGDGTLGALMVPREGGLGLRPTRTLPGSGRPVTGRRIPFAAEAADLVRRAAPHFLPMRTLGWDVAIAPDGPVLIEPNTWWAPFTPLPAEAWRLFGRVPRGV